MTVYVTDRHLDFTVNGVTDRWSHLLADLPSELMAAAHGLGLGGAIHERGRPWCYVDITDAERARAIQLGAQQVGWLPALREMRRRVADFRWPAGGRQPTPFDVAEQAATPEPPASSPATPSAAASSSSDDGDDAPTLMRHEPRLAALFAAQAPNLPPGTFVCGPTRKAAAWKASSPRHAWHDPKEGWHVCEHCGVLYQSVQLSGGRWGKRWEWPDGWGGTASPGTPFPKCPGPGHAHAVSRLPVAQEA